MSPTKQKRWVAAALALAVTAPLGLFGQRPASKGKGLVKDAASELTPSSVKRFLAMIKPRPGEASWAEIPWMTDLYAARKKAAKEGKPLYVWSASADPLGCT